MEGVEEFLQDLEDPHLEEECHLQEEDPHVVDLQVIHLHLDEDHTLLEEDLIHHLQEEEDHLEDLILLHLEDLILHLQEEEDHIHLLQGEALPEVLEVVLLKENNYLECFT